MQNNFDNQNGTKTKGQKSNVSITYKKKGIQNKIKLNKIYTLG